MSHLSRKPRVVLAAALLATALVPSAASAAESVTRTISYQCEYPLIGEAPLEVVIEAGIASTFPVNTPTGNLPITTTVTASGKTYDGFSLIGAAEVRGTVTPRGGIALPGGETRAWTAVSTITPYAFPDTKQDLKLTSTGVIPSQTFPQAGFGTFSVDAISLSLKAIKYDGTAVIFPGSENDSDGNPDTFDVTCRLDPSTQSSVLKRFGIGGPPPVPTPTIRDLEPSRVFVDRAERVVIVGEDLEAVTGVTVGGAPVDFQRDSESSLSFDAPQQPAGTAQVRLVTADGSSADNGNADDLTYVVAPSAPVISSVTPNSGPLEGGNTVTVRGEHLTGVTSVVFGDFATDLVIKSDTELTVTVPWGGYPGTRDVSVTGPGGGNVNTPGDDYTYEAPAQTTPVITTPATTPGSTSPAGTTPRGKLSLTYQCTYPLIGDVPVKVAYTADLPASIPVGQETGESGLWASITASGRMFQGLQLVGATKVANAVRVRSTVALPGGINLPVTAPLTAATVDVPATEQDLVAFAAGSFPSFIFPTPGTASVTLDSIALSTSWIKADGTAVIFPGSSEDDDKNADTFDVTCRLDLPNQNTLISQITLGGSGPIPTTPPRTTVYPTTPWGTTPLPMTTPPVPATTPPMTTPPTTPRPTTPTGTTPRDTTKPVVTIGAVTQSPKVGGVSSLTVAFLTSEAARVSVTLSRHEFGVQSGRNCIEAPKVPPTGAAPKRCVRVVWATPVPSGWFRSGAGALTWPKAPKKGWWTLTVVATDAARNTGTASRYVLLK